ncbi:PKD domain-containing protein, partial [Mangrovimonas aestuarii]|uniref:PKD domain-containing protein n=1 Tax=Mangrovimonas aestuarii TaxID=3018443 RepID=UPI002377FE4F
MKRILLFLILITTTSTIGFAQDLVMQNGTFTTCSGIFYDSGGEFANYGNGETLVITICPEEAGQRTQLDFTAFNTQLNADLMTIYDGDSTAANPFGTFSGSGANSPGFASATPNNPTGCLTIEFVSDSAASGLGWEATISCFTPCQTIVSQIDSAVPAPDAEGIIRVCPNEDITLTGSGQFSVDGTGSSYEWNLGEGTTVPGQTVTFSYDTPGVYVVNLNITDTNPLGCTNTNLINQIVQVATEPDFTGTQAANEILCFGETTTIDGIVEPTPYINECTPPVSGVTFLPDGNGATYQTCITVDCYNSNQTLDDIAQLLEICVNMEHSYLGDLDINIISPNGQTAVLKAYPGGGGTYLGGANDDGSLTPGVGADYCFSMSGSTILESGPTLIAGSPPGNSIIPGTYLPEGSFNTLLGSPLNGDWCIEIIDNLGIDNGYVFSWGMEFDPNIQPPNLSFTPEIVGEAWDPDPTIVNTSGNTITVAPDTPGVYCYTYRVQDDFGCEYTEEVCVEMLPEIVVDTPEDLYVCDPSGPPYIFDLTENNPVMLAPTPSPSDLIITFHNSQADADSDVSPISAPEAYQGVDGEVIYVRVEYLNSNCYETMTFVLHVGVPPVINPVADIETCDDVSNDGVEEFDLSSQTLGILGTQSPLEFFVTYYETLADANAGTNALPDLYSNTNNPQPIYVKVGFGNDEGCSVVSQTPLFNLIVHPRAEATQPDNMVVCDDVSNDGFETFDLTSQNAAILG